MTQKLHILYIYIALLHFGAASPCCAQTIKGNVYGGGELAQVDGNTNVTIHQGTLGTATETIDVYGGGYGGEAKDAIPATALYGTVMGEASVAINNGTIYGDVFGGGAGIEGDSPTDHTGANPHKLPYYMAGWVRKQTTVTMTGGEIYGNVFGGGDLANTGWYTADDQPSTTFTNMSNQEMNLATAIYLNGGDVYGKVFGGGNGRKLRYNGYNGDEYRTWYPELIGAVCGSTLVSVGTKDNKGNVSGAAKIWNRIYGGGQTGKVYTTTAAKTLNTLDTSSTARTDVTSGSTNVEIHSGEVGHNIFGGGLGDIVKIDNNDDDDIITSADVYGSTYVYFGHGAKLIWPKYFDGKEVQEQQAVMNGDIMYPQDGYIADGNGFMLHSPNISHNLYGGGNEACEIKGNSYVYMTGSPTLDVITDLTTSDFFTQAMSHEGRPHFSSFGAGHGYHTKTVGEACTDVCLGEGDVMYNVIGGGLNGQVAGGCLVHVGSAPGSSITNVYGGGYYAPVNGTKVDITKGHIKGNVFGGGLMGDVSKNTQYTDERFMPNTTNTTIGLQSSGDYSYLAIQIPSGSEVRRYSYDNNNDITIDGSVYGGNDVGGIVNGVAGVKIYGGTISQNVYGAGNGDHIGYYEPGRGHYNDGEHENYYVVDHSGDTSKDGKNTIGPKGITYKGRPQTTGGVEVTLSGNNNTDDRVTVLGQVFGGGNSCTIGEWKTPSDDDAHHGNPHEWRDDPDFFRGGGKLHITLGSHVTIGQTNDQVTSEYKNEDGENVSGLFMGNNGSHLATQSTDKEDYYYHHYYDSYTAKYWPGFVVYEDGSSQPISRTEGLKSFKAYLNNILVKSDDVTLKVEADAEDIWLANFVGGGFRGSMQRKTTGKFEYTLPAGVTIGNCVVGGAYNTDVVYRIFDTTDGHNYKESDGHYNYLTSAQDLKVGDYHHIEYDADGSTPIGIIRYYYDGGILSSDGLSTADITKLTLNNNMDASVTDKRRIFAGCFTSGTTKGNTIIDYSGRGTPRIHGGGAYAHVEGNATVNVLDGEAGDVYGGGALADVKGSTFVNLTGGTIKDAYGGGLGQVATDAVGTLGDSDYVPAKPAVAALVGRDATVTLGNNAGTSASKVTGSIFGANNVNGTPKGHVKVHVLKTTPRDGQDMQTRNTPDTPATFDVLAVYGGGNKAAYLPTESVEPLNSSSRPQYYSEVLIENCDNSIAYVYGGGNAAPVPATEVSIYGANAIDYAFAGGNGEGDGNPGADIGYLDYYSTQDPAAKDYGVGTAVIYVYGGTINNVYGGSNTLGYVREHAYVRVLDVPDDYSGACDLHLGHVHAGGNKAEMFCGGSMELACSDGADIVYAGSNNADIHGDIDLVISSGTYGKVFGGNNTSGGIYGHIKIDIDETGCWPVIIGELYGCGNNAPYSVYGYTGSPAVPRDKADFDALNDATKTAEGLPYADPVINIISCTEIGKIFGGGNGTSATVYGSPTVNINPIKGNFAGQAPIPPFVLNNDAGRLPNTRNIIIPDETGRIGDVYGGGNAAPVYGNTRVNIGTKATNHHVSGTDTTTEEDVSVVILGNVFGGSKGVSDDPSAGRVTGTTKVVIGNE